MWGDEINKRIKEAADQYHPAYDEDAWNKMEQMLDEHLPVKKDRRRVIYFLLLTVMVCAELFFVFYPWRKNVSPEISSNTVSNNNTKSEQLKTTTDLQNEPRQGLEDLKNNNEKQNEPAIPGANKKVLTKNNHEQHYISIVPLSNSSAQNVNVKKRKIEEGKTENESGNIKKENGAVAIMSSDNKYKSNTTSPSVISKIEDSASRVKSTKDTTTTKAIAKTEVEKKSISSKNLNKSGKKFIQNIGFNLGIGPDVSGVNLSRAGKLTLAYGAGLSYDFSNRFTLRTGFYISRKIYSVGKNEYKTQAGNGGNYDYLQSVDANCNVYEIPLVLNYNFHKVRNHNWFASAGLSSYLMKKESYVYYYKYPSGGVYDRSWSIANKNKHYFSVLDISGGYAYFINKRLTLSAEPYLKLPLSGIGAGKIKLNSGGMLFTIKLQPFKK